MDSSQKQPKSSYLKPLQQEAYLQQMASKGRARAAERLKSARSSAQELDRLEKICQNTSMASNKVSMR